MKNKIKKLILYLIVFLALLIALPVAFFSSKTVQSYVEMKVQTAVQEELGLIIDYSKFTLSLLPISLNLNDVSVSTAIRTDYSPNIKVRQIKIMTGVHPINLLSHIFSSEEAELIIESIKLVRLDANIYVKDNKVKGLSRLDIDAATPAGSDDATGGAAKGAFTVNRIEIVDSRINITRLDDDSTISVTGINIDANTKNIPEELLMFAQASRLKFKNDSIDEELNSLFLDCKYMISENKLSIKSAQAFSGDKAELKVSGDTRFTDDEGEPGVSYDLDFSVKADGSIIKKRLPDDFEFTGDYEMSGNVSGSGGKFNLTGDLDSGGGNIYGIDFDALSCNVAIDDKKIEVRDIKADIFGGHAVGSYSTEYARLPDFVTKLTVTNWDFADIQRSCPALPTLLGGVVSGDLNVGGEFTDDNFTIKISGGLMSKEFLLYDGLYEKNKKELITFNDLKLDISLDVLADNIIFRDINVTTSDFSANLKGSMPGYKSYDLAFQAHVSNPGPLKNVAKIDVPLSGVASVKGTLGGTLDNPSVTTSLTAFNVTYDKYFIDRSQGEITYKGGRLYFNDLNVLKGDFDLTVDGSILIDDEAELDLRIAVNGAEFSSINGLLSELGEKSVDTLDNLSGSLTGTVDIHGSAKAPEIKLDMAAPYLTAYDLPVDISVKARIYDNEELQTYMVDIKQARITKDQARVDLSGNIVVKDGSFDLEYTAADIGVKHVLSTLKYDDIDVDAKVFSTGRILGADDGIKDAFMEVTVSGMTYNGQVVRNSNFILTYNDDGITVKGYFLKKELKLDLRLRGEKLNELEFNGIFIDLMLDDLISLFDGDADVKATVNGRLKFKTLLDYDNIKDINNYFINTGDLEADIELTDLITAGYKFKEAGLNIGYDERAGDIDMSILEEKIQFSTSFIYDGDIDLTLAEISVTDLLMSDINKYIDKSEAIKGKANISLNFKLNNVISIDNTTDLLANLRDVNGLMNFDDVSYEEFELGKICVNLATKRKLLKIRGICADSLLRISGVVDYKDKKRYEITLATPKELDYPELLRRFKVDLPEDIDGAVKFKLTLSGGIVDYNDYLVLLESDHLTIKASGLEFRNDDTIKVTYDGAIFSVDSLKLKDENSSLFVTGAVGRDSVADLKMGGTMKLPFVKPFLPKEIERIGGLSTFDASVKGDIKDPEVFGTLKIENGVLGVLKFPKNINNITGTIQLSRKELTIKKITGELNKTPVFVTGEVTLSEFKPTSLNLAIDCERLALNYPEGIYSQTTSHLKLEGGLEELVLFGGVDILKLRYTRPVKVINVKDIIKVEELLAADIVSFKDLFPTFKKRKSEPKQYKGKGGSLEFDVVINGEKDLIIDNNVAKCELKGNVNLIGNAADPVIIGNIEIITGKVFYMDKEFEIVSGMVNFANESYISPFFDILAEREVKPTGSDNIYTVSLRLTGEMEDAKLNIDSNPALDKTEIAALILFGIDPAETEEEKGEKRKLEALRIASDIAQKNLQKKLGKYIGFDRFKIDPYYSESSEATSARLIVGKEINDNITVTYTTDIIGTKEQSVELEYSLSKNFSLLGGWEDKGDASRGSFGGDLKFRFGFR